MKVMFNPAVGTAVSCRGTNSAAKQAKELPKRSEGYSNEQIYNALMSFKRSIGKIFSKSVQKTKPLNTIA